jgi:hypothetical protein
MCVLHMGLALSVHITRGACRNCAVAYTFIFIFVFYFFLYFLSGHCMPGFAFFLCTYVLLFAGFALISFYP